jgi:hypothetical protein
MSVAGRACGCRFGRFIFNDTTVLDERLFIAGAVMAAVAIAVIAAMTLAPSCAPPPRRRWPLPRSPPSLASIRSIATHPPQGLTGWSRQSRSGVGSAAPPGTAR